MTFETASSDFLRVSARCHLGLSRNAIVWGRFAGPKSKRVRNSVDLPTLTLRLP